MTLSGLIILSGIYFGLCNWIQVRYLLKNLLKPGSKNLQPFGREALLRKMRRKTGLPLSVKIIRGERRIIGFMVGSPPLKPLMLFSEKLNNEFTDDEMQWVMLHESGHYLMRHNWKIASAQIFLFMLGILLFSHYPMHAVFAAAIMALLAVVYVRIAKIFELQADTYAVKTMDDPNGMISGNTKMREANKNHLQNPIVRDFLIVAVPYDKRIKMARRELDLRPGKFIAG